MPATEKQIESDICNFLLSPAGGYTYLENYKKLLIYEYVTGKKSLNNIHRITDRKEN